MASVPSVGGIPSAPSVPKPPGVKTGPMTLKARAGDYLCRFAADRGFRDCKDFRAANAALADKAVLDDGDVVTIPEKQQKETTGNDQTEVKCKRVNYKPGTVKFLVQGTPLGVPGGPGATRVGISNYITNKSGLDDSGTVHPFFAGKGADTLDAMTDPERKTYADPDHFRVEVHDVVAGAKGLAKIDVELQVLQPLYKRQTSGGVEKIVRDTKSRPDPDAPPGYKVPTNAKRKVTVECFATTANKNLFRSRYLRLVTHEGDEVAGQTLFVGDYFDDGADNDEKYYTEILEQRVRARYTPTMCGETKCRAEALTLVGEMKKEVRLVVHILDDCCSYDDVRRVVYKQCRRAYAQAGVRPQIKEILKHPPPKNIITIGTNAGSGQPPSGQTTGASPVQSKLTVKVDGHTLELPLTGTQSLSNVANLMAALIRGKGLFTKVSEHTPDPPPTAPQQKSRDILVFKDAKFTQYATVTQVTSNDARMSARRNELSAATLGTFPQDDERREHRLLKLCCDSEWFDAIIIKKFAVESGATLFGIATWLHLPFGPCFIVESARMTPAQDPRYTFSHEMGHCLVHSGHCMTAAEKEQLMVLGGQASGNAFDMPGRRRMHDAPMKIKYQVLQMNGTFDGLKELGPGSAYGTAVSRIQSFVTGNPAGPPTDREPGAEW